MVSYQFYRYSVNKHAPIEERRNYTSFDTEPSKLKEMKIPVFFFFFLPDWEDSEIIHNCKTRFKIKFQSIENVC